MNLIITRGVTVILVICAVIVTALLIRDELISSGIPELDPIPVRVLSDMAWQRATDTDPVLGPRAARIKIVKFYDYECPFCRSLQSNLDQIRQKYPDDLAIIHRHYPLSYHPTAYPSAVAAECAQEQGQFEAYHAELFERQESSANPNWIGLAKRVGILNLPDFRECVGQELPSSKIKRDILLADSLEISAIPTLIVEGSVFEGVLSVNDLDKIIQNIIRDDKGSIVDDQY
ncbi:MAG: thioredoxin domain-containing protein [Chloroflexi bacterium]|nr:thioredoxin domain-containing protein [Chloroflexota bacterium]MYG70566.1 thioredoxin domain-containing protein [Rhodothermaceae bacterium]